MAGPVREQAARLARRRIKMWLATTTIPAIPIIAGGAVLFIAIMLMVMLVTVETITSSKTGSQTGPAGGGYGGDGSTPCQTTPADLTLTSVAGYTRGTIPGGWDDQLHNAAVIIQVGQQQGMSQRDQQIALMVAMQESSLRNLGSGDRDSLGLFQQRPSQGWGTTAQIMNPAYAAGQFYTHLTAIGGRDSMSMNDAAQAVQRSGTPQAYGPHQTDAATVLQAIYSDPAATVCVAAPAGGMSLPQAQVLMSEYLGETRLNLYVNPGNCGTPSCLYNCVAFTAWWINKHTSMRVGGLPNGGAVVDTLHATYGIEEGSVPQPYAVFSTWQSSSSWGHTGVVLGIQGDTVIIGEAGYGEVAWTNSSPHTYPLSKFTSGAYRFAYLAQYVSGAGG